MQPAAVVGKGQLWRLATYMFVHSRFGFTHILFNMLSLWMFGVELERMWGTRYFLKFYFFCGVCAALTTLVLSFLPLGIFAPLYRSLTIGASGAIFGVLLAYALYFPHRPILMMFVFPVPANYFVMIMGGISLLASTERQQRRRRAYDAPGRPRRWLPLSEETAPQPQGRDPVPSRQVAHQPHAPEVRRAIPAAAPTTSIAACIRVNGERRR